MKKFENIESAQLCPRLKPAELGTFGIFEFFQ